MAQRVCIGTRQKIYERDGYVCLKCGTSGDLSIDHIVPLSKGGSNKRFNLQTLCLTCNELKGTKTVDYRKEPEYETTRICKNNCSNKCFNEHWCKLIGCIRTHSLINETNILLFDKKDNLTFRDCLEIFKEIKPFKVSDEQIAYDYEKRILRKNKRNGVGKQVKKEVPKKVNKKEPISKPISIDHSTNTEYIIWNNRKCFLYGRLNRTIGFGSAIGEKIYYDKQEEKFIFQYAKVIIAYNLDTLNKFVDKTEVLKSEKIKKISSALGFNGLTYKSSHDILNEIRSNNTPIKSDLSKETLKELIEKLNKEPEPNFHY